MACWRGRRGWGCEKDETERLVDFVAWAFGQKCERGDASLARILSARVVVEELLK